MSFGGGAIPFAVVKFIIESFLASLAILAVRS